MSWQNRLFKVKVGLGTGSNAGSFETVIEGPEWHGAFGSQDHDQARIKWQRTQILDQIGVRFPNETLVLISVLPITGRFRPVWDRR